MTMKLLAPLFAIALVGCTSTGAPTPALQQAAADANIIVAGVAAEVKQVQLLYPTAIPPDKAALLMTDLTAAQVAVGQLTSLTASPTTGTQLQVIETNINSVVAIVDAAMAGVPACQANPTCAGVTLALGAATVLMPGIDAMVNQLLTGTAPVPKAMAVRSGMSPGEARLVLAAAAGK